MGTHRLLPTPNLLPKSLAWLQGEKIPHSELPRRGPTWARRKGLRVVSWGPRGRHQGWASSRLQVSPNHPLRPSGLTWRFSQRETGALRPETLRQGLHEVSHSAAQAQIPFPAPGTATMEARCPVRGSLFPDGLHAPGPTRINWIICFSRPHCRRPQEKGP